MVRRRESSKSFNIGAVKSLYVLDLNQGEQRGTNSRKQRKIKSISAFAKKKQTVLKKQSQVASGLQELKIYKSIDKKGTPNQSLRSGTGPVRTSSFGTGQAAPNARQQSEWKNCPQSKENLLEELERIENYDAKLALSLADTQDEQYGGHLKYYAAEEDYGPEIVPERSERIKELFSRKEESENKHKPKPQGVRGFIFLAAILTFFVSGALFYKNYNSFDLAGLLPQKASNGSNNLKIKVLNPKNYLALIFPDGLNFASASDNISSLFGVINVAKDFYAIAPTVFGHNGPKKYMVAFQNSSELRPTGGFIGSYAAIDISAGEITGIKVDGIYNLDGQLTVNVVPPQPFYHITSAWSAHDANWFLDFPTSAGKIMWFYKYASGDELDGVVSLNVEVIEKMLKITGPVPLPEYGLVLDHNNFRDEVQYEVEADYDKELNRPKKIIADLFPVLMEKVIDILEHSGGQKEILSIILESLEKKDIMLYSKDSNVEKFFAEHGWAGRIDPQRVSGDYLAVVHSNLGGYKTDKYIDNFVDYRVEIEEDGAVAARLTISREHSGGDLKYWWYNRQNIDYVKIYVPLGAEILSYSGGERRVFKNSPDYDSPNFQRDAQVAKSENESSAYGPIDIFGETGKTVFGTWLVTNPKSESLLTLSYKLPFKIDFKDELAKYNLYMQKQPGTKVQTSFDIAYPADWSVGWSKAKSPSPLYKGEGRSEFLLDKDEVIEYILNQ